MNTIKFNKHHVTDGTTKIRVWYGLDNRADGRKVVTLTAKDYDGNLSKIFPNNTENDSDITTDYMVTDRVNIFENHPLYAHARACVEVFVTEKQKEADAKIAAREAARLSLRSN